MQVHLFSLKGMYMTTSLYPSAPAPIPGPGVLQWVGYSIPNIPFPALKLGGDANFGADGNFGSLDGSTFGGNNVPFNPGQQGGGSEQIDNELRARLSSGGTLESNLDDILRAETQKDVLGRERFFNEADLMVGKLLDDAKKDRSSLQLQKSIVQIRQELAEERRKCCGDCD